MFLTIRTSIPGVYSTISFSGLDKKAGEEVPQKLGSREYSDIGIDEGSETEKGDFDMLTTRLNFIPDPAKDPQYAHMYKDFHPQLCIATNPDGPEHYLAKFFFEHPDAPDRAVWMATPYDNRHNLPSGYIEMLEETLQGVTRDRLLHGQWKSAEGLIYDTFSRAVHVNEDFLRTPEGEIDFAAYKDIISGSDSNYPSPRAAVLIGVRRGEHGNEYDVFTEFYEPRTQIETMIAWLEQEAAVMDRSVQDYHDPSDPSGIEKINNGKRLMSAKANNRVGPGISAVAKHFRKKTIRISPRCVGLLRELVSYRWKPGSKKDEPVKENDHACDALRYAIASYEDGTEEYYVG